MGLMRSFLLACSQNRWMREHAPRYGFVRRAVSRFMPGETIEDALAAAQTLRDEGMGTVLTHLGENITDATEAGTVAEHYKVVLDRIAALRLPTEISVKLTQLGLDLGRDTCFTHLRTILEHAGSESLVWIDIESSDYVDATLEIFRRARETYPNVGLCLQSYLYRTDKDLEDLLPLRPAIRLVKGAYREPPDRAYPRKSDVDTAYLRLAQRLLSQEARELGVRAALATHDPVLIAKLIAFGASEGLPKESMEFQMLFGIQRAQQMELARQGHRSIVLISYGEFWYPWFVRRLAERPANVWFVVRNLIRR